MTAKNPQHTPSHGAMEALLDETELARFLGVSVSWLQRARWAGNSIPYSLVGRKIRYSFHDVQAYLESRRRTGTTRDASA